MYNYIKNYNKIQIKLTYIQIVINNNFYINILNINRMKL